MQVASVSPALLQPPSQHFTHHVFALNLLYITKKCDLTLRIRSVTDAAVDLPHLSTPPLPLCCEFKVFLK